MPVVGSPSDDISDVLAVGRSGVTTIYASLSARHPEGDDADYLEWHTLDHPPEQYRLAAVRASLRVVSTPACRAARAASDKRYDAVDHVMTYFFSDIAGLTPFNDLAVALRNGGRIPYLLPAVERGVYAVSDVAAAPRVKVGADVLPWWPVKGVYLLLERGEATATDLTEVPGVAGVWSATAIPRRAGVAGLEGDADPLYGTAEPGQQITYCFLDTDPVDAAERLRPVLEQRWDASGSEPRLAAPFHTLVPHEWSRYLP